MFNHTPNDYRNPFKLLVDGNNFDEIKSNKEDIFYQDERITAFISTKQWPNNPGNAMVIPNEVYENLYDIPDDLLGYIHAFSKQIAIAMKEVYGCDGTSIRQHNEPAGNQEVWHYHLHVFPRYNGDDLYSLQKESHPSDPNERAEYAGKLREYFSNKE